MGFFGLKPENKAELHSQIFQLMYFGKGFNHSDVYNMPIYLRNFYYKKLLEVKKKEADEVEKAQKKHKSISTPNINPRFKR